jgi:hypothetical protein
MVPGQSLEVSTLYVTILPRLYEGELMIKAQIEWDATSYTGDVAIRKFPYDRKYLYQARGACLIENSSQSIQRDRRYRIEKLWRYCTRQGISGTQDHDL